MRRHWLWAGLFFCALPAIAADLVLLRADEPARPGKTPLRVEFRERERTGDASIVEVTFTSGASVAGPMFIMKGFCAVARARGKPYFEEKEIARRSEDGRQISSHRVTFPATAPADMQARLDTGVIGVDDCAAVGF